MIIVYLCRRSAKLVADKCKFSPGKGIAGLGALTFRASVVCVMATGSAQAAELIVPPAKHYGYSILSEVMRDEFPTLQERLGSERFRALNSGGGVATGTAVSARIDGVSRNIEADDRDSTNPISEHEWEQHRGEAAVGFDIPVPMENGTALLGASVHGVYSTATVHAFSPGEVDVDSAGFGLGLAATFFSNSGFYADLQLRVSYWDTDVDFKPDRVSESLDGISGGASLELGNRINLNSSLAVIPRVQATYTNVDFDSFKDADGDNFRQLNGDSLLLGGGLLIEYAMRESGVSVYSDFSAAWDTQSDSGIKSSGVVVKTGLEDVWGNLSIGTAIQLGEDTSVYLQGNYSSSLDEHFRESVGYGFTAGISVNF
jgi:fibronectin-binding autotransporter adhesin